MNSASTILLTGFTGILGKRFAYRLAALGHRVVCPIRAGSEAEARERFRTVFHSLRELMPGFDEAIEKQLCPIPGDVRQKGLGIPSAYLDELKGPKTAGIWHLAALLDLTESNSQDVYDTNLLGTLHVLEFARQQRIAEVHYFSTFGSSGKLHEGVVREIPGIRPPSFRNTYERTKWEAERHVWQAQIRGDVLATIYRPSIVVGDSVFGRYEQFNAFNHAFYIGSRMRVRLCEEQGLDPKTAILKYDLRIPGDENATLNIVPLDFVLDTVMKIFAVPRSRGRVYHIVNPSPPSLRLTMDFFKRHEPWDGLRWEVLGPNPEYLNPHEKFVARQLDFLAPYLLGEATYDYSNVQTILALHGGIPPLKNDGFLDAISRRGAHHGWQEAKADAALVSMSIRRESLHSGFVWPEGSGLVVDFSPHHPVGKLPARIPQYTMTERLLGKAYQMRERLFEKRGEHPDTRPASRDIVFVPFGMGVTRRGEAEVRCYSHEEALADHVFAQLNQVVGFDLRAYGRESIPGHEQYADIHDHCCWAVADDLVHLMRLFRDIQRTGGIGLMTRLQILPHSAGTYLSAWLAGVVSFQDMALITHQSAHLMAENETMISDEDVTRWFLSGKETGSEAEGGLLTEIRRGLVSTLPSNTDALAARLHGRMELVFSLNAHLLQALIAELQDRRIGAEPAIIMSPNCAVFAGDELQMSQFRRLFVGKRKIELRRVSLEVHGTPHFKRLREASRKTTDLLQIYDRQGRLRDPVIPFASFSGEWVRTREQFIQAVAGIADQTCYFDRMIQRALEEGGRHFFLIQSGMSSAAGDLFEGIIRNKANSMGCTPVHVYPPAIPSGDPHPVCQLLDSREENCVVDAPVQPLAQTIRWYENQLSAANPS
ncbi:MAG: SDR family oxidoreductase [Verrucomicrobia bacterium]|nr:SDR family oxidoreductase [Verrucomicrobiota bacterium]